MEEEEEGRQLQRKSERERGVGVWSNKQEEGEKCLAGERSAKLRGGEKRGERRCLAVKQVI